MHTALVTGASGHLGANLVRELLDHGWSVRGFVRLRSDLSGLRGLDVDLAYGDLLEPDSLVRAMEGVDVVFHAGAVYRNWAADPDEILRPAIEGTENALRAAARAGVQRVVMTSSCNAVGFTDDPSRVPNEETWNEDTQLDYVRGKVQSERRAWELAEELGLELVTLLPTGVLGPHDHRMTPTMAYARDFLSGKGPVIAGGANLVHVRDVARAHRLAAERGVAGRRYLIGGENLSDMHLVDLIAQQTGRRPSILALPYSVMYALAWVMERVASLRGAEPDLNTAMVRTAWGRHALFDTSRAREELGFEARPAEEVLADTADWLVRMGELAPAPVVPNTAYTAAR